MRLSVCILCTAHYLWWLSCSIISVSKLLSILFSVITISRVKSKWTARILIPSLLFYSKRILDNVNYFSLYLNHTLFYTIKYKVSYAQYFLWNTTLKALVWKNFVHLKPNRFRIVKRCQLSIDSSGTLSYDM